MFGEKSLPRGSKDFFFVSFLLFFPQRKHFLEKQDFTKMKKQLFGEKVFREGRKTFVLPLFCLFVPQRKHFSKSGKNKISRKLKNNFLEKKVFRGVGILFLCLVLTIFVRKEKMSKLGEKTYFTKMEKQNTCLEKKSSEGVGRLFLCLVFAFFRECFFRKNKIPRTSRNKMFGGKIFREGRLTFSLSLFSLFFPQKHFSRKTHFHEN